MLSLSLSVVCVCIYVCMYMLLYIHRSDRRARLVNDCQRLLALRLWKDDSSSLFAQLKDHCQNVMSRIAAECHQVFNQIVEEPGGPALREFDWACPPHFLTSASLHSRQNF